MNKDNSLLNELGEICLKQSDYCKEMDLLEALKSLNYSYKNLYEYNSKINLMVIGVIYKREFWVEKKEINFLLDDIETFEDFLSFLKQNQKQNTQEIEFIQELIELLWTEFKNMQ